MNIKKLNEKLAKIINESEEKTFADWYGEDLSGQTYNGDIIVPTGNITSLEGAPQKVTGDFRCAGNNLITLQGAPEKVGGTFNCYNNKLTTLQGAPKEVTGYFNCGENNLTSLEGAPQEVGGDFDCYNNNLNSLEGAPQQVGGSFDCRWNNLTTLEGAPEYVGGYFDCSKNNLTSLEFAPEKVDGYFRCDQNELTTLKGAPKYIGRDFSCTKNPNLKSLDGIGEVRGDIKTDIKTKKAKTSSSEIVLNIEATGGVTGNTSISVSKDFFNWSEKKQIQLLQSEIDDSGSAFYAEEDPDGYNLSYLTIEELTIDETGGSAEGTWEAEYYNEFGDMEEETEIPVTFELDI